MKLAFILFSVSIIFGTITVVRVVGDSGLKKDLPVNAPCVVGGKTGTIVGHEWGQVKVLLNGTSAAIVVDRKAVAIQQKQGN